MLTEHKCLHGRRFNIHGKSKPTFYKSTSYYVRLTCLIYKLTYVTLSVWAYYKFEFHSLKTNIYELIFSRPYTSLLHKMRLH